MSNDHTVCERREKVLASSLFVYIILVTLEKNYNQLRYG